MEKSRKRNINKKRNYYIEDRQSKGRLRNGNKEEKYGMGGSGKREKEKEAR